ncbi:MAG: nicotinate phosphoribosyltransferase [Gammaproteobacteria bacterium]|nr:nicotinate phosphoribosyltransferase [Gammaproteobacteria bacterium]
MSRYIQSLLDTDLYKFTMMQVIWRQYKKAEAEYQFFCRTPGVSFLPCLSKIEQGIDAFCTLTFHEDELNYCASLPYIRRDFVAFLKDFRFNRNAIHISTKTGKLEIVIRGLWHETILYEVPLLAIINEAYYQSLISSPDYEEGKKRLQQKIALVKQHPQHERFIFSDFGTRRRFSFLWQRTVLDTLQKTIPKHLAGTSNVHLAKAMGLIPIGTMAHEFLQAFQALTQKLEDSQKCALHIWLKEYGDDLGIALSDVITLGAFLRDFDEELAHAFQGVRQDSGDPFLWGEAMIEHYQKFHINPKKKTLVFSDQLTFPKALEIYDRFRERTNPVFGIGTNLMNDLGYPQLDIVIKMTRLNGQPVAKLSDNLGKAICTDDKYFNRLCEAFKVKPC